MKITFFIDNLIKINPFSSARQTIHIDTFLKLLAFNKKMAFGGLVLSILLINGNVFAVDSENNNNLVEIELPSTQTGRASQKNEPFPEEPLPKKTVENKIQLQDQVANIPSKDLLPKLRESFLNSKKTTMETTTIVQRLSQEFSVLKKDILTAAIDPNEQTPFRVQMLEVLNEHIDDKDTEKALLDVFKEGNPSSKPTAYAAKYLSEQGVDIGDEIVKNFPGADVSVRPIYLRAMGRLKRNDAINIVREELIGSVDFHSRLAATEALGLLSDIDSHNSVLLLDIAQNKGQLIDGKRPPRTLEIEARRAVSSLSLIGDKNIENLLKLSANNDLATNIRIAAVISLQKHITNKNIDIAMQLQLIEQEFSLSSASQTDKIRFKQMVYIVTGARNDRNSF